MADPNLDEKLQALNRDREKKFKENLEALTQRQRLEAQIKKKTTVNRAVKINETAETIEEQTKPEPYQQETEPQQNQEPEKEQSEEKESPKEEKRESGDEEKPEEKEEEPEDEEKEPEPEEDKDKEEEPEDEEEKEPEEDEEEEEDKDKEEEPESEEEPEAEGEPAEGAGEGAGEAAGETAGEAAGEAAAEAGAEAAAEAGAEVAAEGLIAGTAEIWGPVLAIIAGIGLLIALVMIIFTILIAGCNQGGIKGAVAKGATKVASWLGALPADVCKTLAIGTDVQAPASVQAPVGNLDIILTSAYRPGPPSADSRGETVDIALRNPTDPLGSTDPRIDQLLQIIASIGFVAPQGYVQDEYRNPSPGATGGHIHVQFNLKPDGSTYCDGTRVSNPPKDLVPIPSTIPMSGVSNPKLRQCMLDPVEEIFSAADFTP